MKGSAVYAVIEATDTIVHRFTPVDKHTSTEHAILYDGDQERFYYKVSFMEGYIRLYDGRTWEKWQIAWKGAYKEVRRQYMSVVHEVIIARAGFHSNHLPDTEDGALAFVREFQGSKG